MKKNWFFIFLAATVFIHTFIYAQDAKEAAPQIVQDAQKQEAQTSAVLPSAKQDVISSPAVSILPATDFDPSTETLQLYVGQTQYIPVNSPKSLRIGNPAIADIGDVENNQVALTAKAAGQTTFIWADKYGSSSLLIKVMGEDLSPIKARIERVLNDLGFQDSVTLGVNEDEGKIFMAGSLKSEEAKQRLNLGIERMKDKIIDLVTVNEEKPLVEIEVQVYDVNETFIKNIGVAWPQSIAVTWPAIGAPGVGTWQRLFNFDDLQRTALAATFNFAITEGLARTLAHPKLVTLSGKEATINAGGEYPLLEQQGQGITVSYKPYGVVLKIKPTVLDNDKIQTEVQAEVSAIDNTVTTTASYGAGGGQSVQTFDVSGFTNRSIQTELYMKQDQTLMMGGLIHRNESKSTDRLPGLGKLPFFNQLFRNSSDTVAPGRELVIMITPRIIRQKDEIKKQETVQQDTVKIIPQENYRRVPYDLKEYIYDLKARIFQNASYPADAVPLGIGGIVKLKVHILKTGQLDQVVIETSSGSTVLDNAALTLVKDLAPYKPLPTDSRYEDVWVDIPLVYNK